MKKNLNILIELEKQKEEKFMKDTWPTNRQSCHACPYVVYGSDGYPRCYKDMYNDCWAVKPEN